MTALTQSMKLPNRQKKLFFRMDEENFPLFLSSTALPYSYINFYLPDEKVKHNGPPLLYFQSGYAPKLYHQILIQSGFVKTIDLSRASVIVGSNKHENCNTFLLPQQDNQSLSIQDRHITTENHLISSSLFF